MKRYKLGKLLLRLEGELDESRFLQNVVLDTPELCRF